MNIWADEAALDIYGSPLSGRRHACLWLHVTRACEWVAPQRIDILARIARSLEASHIIQN